MGLYRVFAGIDLGDGHKLSYAIISPVKLDQWLQDTGLDRADMFGLKVFGGKVTSGKVVEGEILIGGDNIYRNIDNVVRQLRDAVAAAAKRSSDLSRIPCFVRASVGRTMFRCAICYAIEGQPQMDDA